MAPRKKHVDKIVEVLAAGGYVTHVVYTRCGRHSAKAGEDFLLFDHRGREVWAPSGSVKRVVATGRTTPPKLRRNCFDLRTRRETLVLAGGAPAPSDSGPLLWTVCGDSADPAERDDAVRQYLGAAEARRAILYAQRASLHVLAWVHDGAEFVRRPRRDADVDVAVWVDRHVPEWGREVDEVDLDEPAHDDDDGDDTFSLLDEPW